MRSYPPSCRLIANQLTEIFPVNQEHPYAQLGKLVLVNTITLSK